MTFAAPRSQPLVGHLGRWGTAPLVLLEEGATLGPVFALRLWRKAFVGFSPQWNRFLLTDLATFRSRGSLSGLSPYLAGGIVRSDLPLHRAQRVQLNPGFHRRSVAVLAPVLGDVVRRNLPSGEFDAVGWSADVTRQLLSAAFFGGHFPTDLLSDFVSPLDTKPPGPFVRRPQLFRRMNHALTAALVHAEENTLASSFATMNDGVEEARVALGAAYDTTAHTMAWLLWHLADPSTSATSAHLVSETLRLYPSGWLGSRVASRDVEFDGTTIEAGTLLFYSPYLTHRDPQLWPDPLAFRPARFADALPPWGYLPFSAGPRTCLGASLATLILTSVADIFAGRLTRAGAAPTLRAGLTLAPAGPILLRRQAPSDQRRQAPSDQRRQAPSDLRRQAPSDQRRQRPSDQRRQAS